MPNITEAEWPIMVVLWDKGTATSAEIIETVTRDHDVTKLTLKSLINRLVRKAMIAYTIDRHDARIYYYRPLIARDEATRIKNESLLNTVYGKNALSLLTRFVEDCDLSAEDIARLQAILAKKQAGARGGPGDDGGPEDGDTIG
ncbi:MAG: BlaI/MecI/CopY family transcriptional regulator [Planctomycetaceae bacterium]|nr:BlaI/MecI/CopY family transcriptional regulator [Planctomycetaceae bacterium]